MSKLSVEEKNNKVRAVLLAAKEPIGPTEIAKIINEPWCTYAPGFGSSAAITPICRRIGATRTGAGKYSIAAK